MRYRREKMKSVIAIPEYVKVYAEFKNDNNESRFTRIFFAGLFEYDEGDRYIAFLEAGNDGIFCVAEDNANFVRFHITEDFIPILPFDDNCDDEGD